MSTLHTNTVETSSGGPVTLTKQDAFRFWINYNGDNNTVRDSLNNSSVTDDGTGLYDFVYTNNFADTNYCRLMSVTRANSHASSEATCSGRKSSAVETNQFAYTATDAAGTFKDIQIANGASIGDLA